jgi:hypothetical protein
LLRAGARDAAKEGELRRPRRVHEGLVRADERLAERLHDAGIVLGGLHEAVGRAAEGEVVLVPEVDDALGGLGGGDQTGEIVEISANDFGARLSELLGRRLGPRQAGDLVPSADQLGDDRETDVTTRSSDENAHGNLLITETAMGVAPECSICNHNDSY